MRPGWGATDDIGIFCGPCHRKITGGDRPKTRMYSQVSIFPNEEFAWQTWFERNSHLFSTSLIEQVNRTVRELDEEAQESGQRQL